MSIIYKILGKPGYDNALFLQINSGSRFYRILFDCGENVLETLENLDIKNLDYLFFSHLHIDHISGFDYFFRRNYDREKPVHIFGPQHTIEIIHNRLRGFIWNWIDDSPGEWIINDIMENKLTTSKFLTKKAFISNGNKETTLSNKIVLENEDFEIEAVLLNHSIPSVAYKVCEKPFMNIDEKKIIKMNLPKGKWLEKLRKQNYKIGETIKLNKKTFTFDALSKKLLIPKERDSIAYLTDFIFDEKAKINAVNLVKDCKTVVCESQYLNKDLDHANKNFHLTAGQAAEIAQKADVKKLYLFHISDRYKIKENYPLILKEARSVFPNTFFPEEWNLQI